MKKFLNIFYVLMFLVVAASVSAAASFSMNDLSFGAFDQIRGQDATATLTVTNNGDQQLAINLSSKLPSNYNVRFSQSVLTLAPGASNDVTVTLYIPLSEASDKTAISGGIYAVSNAAGVTRTSAVYITTVSELEIYKATLELNNDGDEHSVSASSTYNKDTKAGTPLKITVYVRNNFDSVADIDISDINIDIRSSGELDLDESDSFNDLSYGDKDKISFTTDIPTDAEDGDRYDITMKVTGHDQNGALHTDTRNFEIEVQRTSHEITIKNEALSPQVVSCGGRATVSATLDNTGRYDEDKVHLLIENLDLGLSQRFYEMSINKDDTLKKTYTFNVANKTAPGQYDIILTSFYDTNTDSDTKVLTLTVEPCTLPTTPVVVQPTNPVVVQPNIPSVVPSNGATVAYGTSTFTDSPLYVVLLVAAVVVLLVILIILLVKFVF